LVEYGESAVH